MADQLAATEQTVEKMDVLNRTIKIFSEPRTVFENIRVHPTWIYPLLVAVLMAIAFTYIASDEMVAFQKEAIYENKMIPEEFKDTAIEQIENKTPLRQNLENSLGSLVNIFIVYLIGAAAFLLMGNFILGGQARFKQMFSMFSWVGLIGVLEMLVKLPLILAKGSMNVYTSLAVLMEPADKKTILFQLLNAFDVFTIWKIILWSMGVSIIYQFSKAKGYTAAVSLYVVYLAVSIGLSQLF